MTTLEAMLSGPEQTERLGRISAGARRMSFGRMVLSLLAFLLVGLGRIAYVACAGLWVAATWSAAAVRVGWDDARAVRDDDKESG